MNNLIWIFFAIIFFCLVSSRISIYVNLSKEILISDVLAHATLPGILISYAIFETKNLFIFWLFAILSSLSAKIFYNWLSKNSIIKNDSIQAILIAIYFSLGLVISTYVQKYSTGDKLGIEHILFGQVTGISKFDLTITIFSTLVILFILFYIDKRLIYTIFDRTFYKVSIKKNYIEIILTIILTSIIAIGLQLVGVILISSLLIIPYMIANCWTNQLSNIKIICSSTSILSGILGIILSYYYSFPAGATIAIILTIFFIFSFFAGNNSGVIWNYLKQLKKQSKRRQENILRSIYKSIELRNLDSVSKSVVHAFLSSTYKNFESELIKLENKKYLQINGDKINLTKVGLEKAIKLTRYHRIWESYLIEKLNFKEDHVHENAEIVEHYFSDEFADKIDQELKIIQDPHGRLIPDKEK